MLKSLTVIFLAVSLAVQQCDKGCLKCNAKNGCVFCDTTNNYFLSSSTCSLSSQTNCSILAQNGNCARCASNFYLDASTRKCVAVETTRLIANCSYYSSIQACVSCAKGYFIKDGQCAAITKTVDNCESYSDDGKCEKCDSGYLFIATRDSCVASPNIPGCGSYTFRDCKTCSSGYITNHNLYFNDWQINSSNIFDAVLKSISGVNDWTPVNRCQKIQDPNCLVASSYNVCLTCDAGYFLTSTKTCRAYPKPIIQYCLTYNSLTTCAGCLPGYYLESNTKCTLITEDKIITDCLSYDSTASAVICTSCAPSKYLIGNACTNFRVNSASIENCKVVSVNADTCQACNDGFVLRFDGLKCLAAVPNCLNHNPTTSKDLVVTCKDCKNGYYFNTDSNGISTCLAGGINGCLVYTSKDVCSLCDTTGFYLSNNTCVPHPKVSNCINYNARNFGECTSCATGYYPFKLVDTCEQIAITIPNCISYNKNDSKCLACANGYFLKTDSTCVALSTLPGCKTATAAGICTECLEGYAKKADNTCELNHDYITSTCAKLTPNAIFKTKDQVENSQCEICKENTYPLALDGNFVCMKSSTYSIRYPLDYSNAVNCARFSVNFNSDNELICNECRPGYYLKYDGDDPSLMWQAVCTSLPVDESAYTCADHIIATNQSNVCVKQNNLNSGYYAMMEYCAKSIMSYHEDTSCLKISLGLPATTRLVSVFTNPSNNLDWYEEFEGSTVPKVNDDFWYSGYQTVIVTGVTDQHSTAAFGDDVGQVTSDQLACELYSFDFFGLVCWRCKWGFTVRFTSITTTSCVKLACNTSVKYGGFSSKLNQLLSCHACSDNTKVLTLSLKNTAFKPSLYMFGGVLNKNTIQCLTPLNADAAAHTVTQPKKIDNCLIYGLIFDPAENFIAAGSGCLSCAPGYVPSVATAEIADACVKIPDCDETQNYYSNRCYACTQVDSNGVKQYKAFENLALRSCKITNTPNCLFVSATQNADSTFQCDTCKPGFYLNKDLYCEKVTLAQCADSSVTFLTTDIEIQQLHLKYIMVRKLNKNKGIKGCNTCNSGYDAFIVKSGERQCLGSSYVTNNSYPAITKYIPDCARYKNEANFNDSLNARCDICKNNKVVTLDGLKCIIPTDSKCKIAKNIADGSCLTCVDTHVAVNGRCVAKNISDCVTYDTSSNVNELLCIACKTGYVLSSSKKSCSVGNVYGCKVYQQNQPWQCATCNDGFILINTSNARNYCLKINENSNCSALDPNSVSGLQSKLYKCTACISNNTAGYIPKAWAIADTSKPQSICLALNPVDNCEEYDSGNTVVDSNSFLCSKCKNGFYLDESKNVCVVRVNVPASCTEFEVRSDKCKVCSANTFITVDAKDCVAFPNGIYGCATYSNDTVCSSCSSPRYLVNNTCELSTVINNCAAYSANYTCTACESGYFLTNSTFCEQAKAIGCQTYISINACATCDPNNSNKGLKTENGVTSCVDKNVANCDQSTNQFPFSCITCKKDYYIGADGNCQPATVIDKCLVYDTASTCILCEKGSVLAVDRKSCNSTIFVTSIDASCDNTQQLSTPVCAMCAPGQIFSNGTCSLCLNNTAASGCFSCNPNNQSECFACKPGYYQTPEGACINTTPLQNEVVIKSAMTLSFVGLLSMLVALLF